MLYDFNSYLTFYHWGDIDLGGFRIFNHLKSKTGIPFKPLYMDLATLKRYEQYALSIGSEYEKQLQELLNQVEYQDFYEVIRYMINKRIRLEQEIVSIEM